MFLEGVFWIARTGSPWRDLPAEFGKWYTTYTRYHRWEKKGVWPRVVDALQREGATVLRYDESGMRWAAATSAPSVERDAEPDRAAA